MRHPETSARGLLAKALELLLVVAACAFALPCRVADAQSPAARVRRMTAQAMRAYDALELERAERLLARALAEARRRGVHGRALAELHLARGVVAAGGLDDVRAAEEAFIEALFADPGIELDRMRSNPTIERAFEAARAATSGDAAPPVAPQTVAALAPEPAPPTAVAPPGDPAPGAPRPAAGRARFFVRAGYAAGTAYARRGGIADRGIPFHPGSRPADWDEGANGVYAPPGYASEGAWYDAIVNEYRGFTENPDHPYPLSVPVTVDGVTLDAGPLRPDPDCHADAGELCVRLDDEGFVFLSGFDVEAGYRVLPDVALSLGMRLSFPAGEGALARALLMAQVEVALTRATGRGFHASAAGGVGIGQIQLPIPQGDGLVEPFIATGLGNLHGSVCLGYRLSPHFGVFTRPTVHVMFPRSAIAYELVVGAETGF